MKAFTPLIALPLLVALPVAAQGPVSYPDRAIRIIVPYTAGGAADLISRMVGQKMSQEMGQAVIVENRTGADGTIGAEAVARAAPDGYTILLGDIGNLTFGPAVRRSAPFDPVRDFAPITQLVAAPNILAVHPSLPANSFRDFIAYARANPGKIAYASPGTGTAGHLPGELLKNAAGINIVHIPYKGGAAAVLDVLRGDVQAMFGLSPVLPHLKDGKLRALATTALKRTPFLPQVPAIAEMGYPGFEATAWYGFLAPAGSPRAVVSRLHDSALRGLRAPDVKASLEAAGNELVGSSPEVFAAYIKAERTKWVEIVAVSGIKAQ